jgi:uncharacterized protein (DUF169 family)
MSTDWNALATTITEALHLELPPVAITFADESPDGLPAFDAPMSKSAADGRQGRVSAGCVFWGHAAAKTFSTAPEDHGNCSVGSLTHGLKSLEEVAGNDDVSSLLASGWVTMDMVPGIPTVSKKPVSIIYGPLAESPVDPDVVLLRVNGRQMMVLSDAIPGLRIEGKPQCHIVAVAKEQGVAAASVGCALSRARTGMKPHEMTCAIPAAEFSEVARRVRITAEVDSAVAKYAAQDARRFA